MPLTALPVGPDAAQWPVWSTLARLVVTDPAALPGARDVVDAQLEAVELACSRFREDSELRRVQRRPGEPRPVSPLLGELVAAALLAAERTGGDVDPTVGSAMRELGYDRDLALLPALGPSGRLVGRPVPGWRRVRLRGNHLTLPAGVALDLGATAKAWAADQCARLVAQRCDTGVLVCLGGDLATAGAAPPGGWRVLLADGPGDPSTTVALGAGAALATSSTTSRQWGPGLHHVLDPRTGTPARRVWRTVSVATGSCLEANTLSTAALVRGLDALPWLRALGVPARLVTAGGRVVRLAGWPADTGR